jgi:NADPH:quinone reductase-like Zn-dependent oxidoreductase
MVIGNLPQMILGTRTKAVVDASAKDTEVFTADAFAHLLQLAATGVLKPVIDRTLPLERIVEAHALVDSGRKRGSVVVTVAPD